MLKQLICSTAISLLAFSSLQASMGVYVGELQELWQFPSDHLPIGMTYEGLHIASWNVLNSHYVGWIEKNGQGLARSSITQAHKYIEESNLTLRDVYVIQSIQAMLDHDSHPRSIITLQECSPAFITELERVLPACYVLILSAPLSEKDQNIVIYDSRVLYYDTEKSEIVSGVFTQDNRELMKLVFSLHDKEESTFTLINTHLPGAPSNPAPFELARYLCAQNGTILAMGDMNFNEEIMQDAMSQALQEKQQYTLLAPYCTNISPDNLFSKSIDHFIVISPQEKKYIANSANEVLPSLDHMVELLHFPRALVGVAK